jgi:Ca-activated chloride channel family protein
VNDLLDPQRWGEPAWLHALWSVPAAGALIWLAARARAATVRRLVGMNLAEDLTRGASRSRRALKAACLLAALASIALALSAPRWNAQEREVERQGRSLVFLIDVSRSMLTEDLAPNRLERAKIWVRDLVAELEGDQIALVAFAGAPRVVCPLTLDRSFFELQLERLGPDSAPRGGTAIGDAIRKATTDVLRLDPEAGAADDGRFRDIILITDGEDQQSFPIEAAQAAGSVGVRIIALGLGSESGGAVPAPDDAGRAYQTYQGQTVVSRLDGGTLESVAGSTPGGAFLRIGTDEVDLGSVYRDLIAAGGSMDLGAATVTEYDERFWVFIALAVLALTIETLLPEGKRAKEVTP